MKPWYKSKTIWFNVLIAALTALEASFGLFEGILPLNIYAVLATLLAVGNAVLRIISTATLTK
jgi:hypothetical protein